MKKLGLVVTMIFVLVAGIIYISPKVYADTHIVSSVHKDTLDRLSLKDVDRVMIVAHPDDETIWAGEHILKDKYLIVCLTNGDNKERAKEFEAVMKASNNPFLMLKYPDKTNGKRNSWKDSKASITKDLQVIIGYKKWQQIVTHNPDGEYGHKHHKKTSKIVTKIAVNDKQETNLIYFGKYYKRRHIQEIKNSPHLDKQQMKQKNELFKPYASQMKVKKHLYHMFPYENWIPYKQWK